jgi:DNA-binding response OmpR family regulator
MLRVLVIDDDESVRSFICEVLEEKGYSVEAQSDGALGLKAYARQSADLVLTDIVMPNKEGLETIQGFHRTFPEAKIIAMSGGLNSSSFDPLPLALQFGANCILRKPFGMNELLDAISRTIS